MIKNKKPQKIDSQKQKIYDLRLQREPDLSSRSVSQVSEQTNLEKPLLRIYTIYSKQYIRNQNYQTFESRSVTHHDFNIGKFSKFLSDFGIKLPIRKINEIFNTTVAKEHVAGANKELLEKGRTRSTENVTRLAQNMSKNESTSPYLNDISHQEPYLKNNMNMTFKMFKSALLKVAYESNLTRIAQIQRK